MVVRSRAWPRQQSGIVKRLLVANSFLQLWRGSRDGKWESPRDRTLGKRSDQEGLCHQAVSSPCPSHPGAVRWSDLCFSDPFHSPVTMRRYVGYLQPSRWAMSGRAGRCLAYIQWNNLRFILSSSPRFCFFILILFIYFHTKNILYWGIVD